MAKKPISRLSIAFPQKTKISRLCTPLVFNFPILLSSLFVAVWTLSADSHLCSNSTGVGKAPNPFEPHSGLRVMIFFSPISDSCDKLCLKLAIVCHSTVGRC